MKKRRKRLGNYNIGEVWWTQFPFEDSDEDKHRPAIVIYNHKLYKLLLTDIPESMRDDSFEIDGIKYSWMSFEELEVDLNTMQKNDDVIAFVKSKI